MVCHSRPRHKIGVYIRSRNRVNHLGLMRFIDHGIEGGSLGIDWIGQRDASIKDPLDRVRVTFFWRWRKFHGYEVPGMWDWVCTTRTDVRGWLVASY